MADEVGRQRHKAVIAVDHDQRSRVRRPPSTMSSSIAAGRSRIEEHLADEDEIIVAVRLARRRRSARGSVANGSAATRIDREQPSSSSRAICRVKEWNSLSLVSMRGGRSHRQRGEEAPHEIVRVGRERDRCAGSGKARIAAMPRCARGITSPKIDLPFVVGQPRGVGECPAMSLAGRVGPEMMAVRGKMDAAGPAPQKLAEMLAEIERHRRPLVDDSPSHPRARAAAAGQPRARNEIGRQPEQIGEDAVLGGGLAQIVMTGGAAGADLDPDHPLHHERVAISPQRQGSPRYPSARPAGGTAVAAPAGRDRR